MKKDKKREGTFNQIASMYDEARPKYPDAIIEDIIALSNIPPNGRILEIGCGTGQATLPFASRGYTIDCIELGDNLAEIVRHNLADYPKVKVTVGDFETTPIQADSYDLVLSATAFHWIDPEIRFKKPYEILKATGAIALFWAEHVQTELSAHQFTALQEAYRKVASDLTKSYELVHPDDFPTHFKDAIESSGYFADTQIRKHRWSVQYDAKTYVNLLNTMSDHQLQDETSRTHLFDEITSIINTQFDGYITKEYLSVLYVAHRR